MRIKFSIFLFIGVINCFTNCKSTQDLAIVQNNYKTSVSKKSQMITIDKGSFSLKFKTKKYTENSPIVAKLTAFSNKNDLNDIKIGLYVKQTKCFDQDDALALTPDGYDALYIIDDGFHALYYENVMDKSVELLSKKDDFINVAFHIKRLFINKQYIAINAYKLPEIYIALFIDTNINDTIDEGELTKFTIQFKN